MWRCALPCHGGRINGRTPERWVWRLPSLCASRTPGSASASIGSKWAATVKRSVCGNCWSQQLTPFIVSSSGRDNSIKGFTGLQSSRFTQLLMASLRRWAKCPWNPMLRDSWWILVLRHFGGFLHQHRVGSHRLTDISRHFYKELI